MWSQNYNMNRELYFTLTRWNKDKKHKAPQSTKNTAFKAADAPASILTVFWILILWNEVNHLKFYKARCLHYSSLVSSLM